MSSLCTYTLRMVIALTGLDFSGADTGATSGAAVSDIQLQTSIPSSNAAVMTQFIMTNEINQQLKQHYQPQANARSLLANNPLLTGNGVITTTTSNVDSKPVITISPGKSVKFHQSVDNCAI